MSFLQLQGLTCGYPGQTEYVVYGLNLALAEGDIACLLGPSGCGKTTVLRAIAGFHDLAKGSITLDGVTLSDQRVNIAPEARQVGLMFQDYALFPHMTVYDNVTFSLHQSDQQNQQHICRELLALVKLSDMAQRYPHELSGGQQQRVALARALAARPRLLLLDEPFSNLDVELRRALTLEVRDILKQQNITAIMVTHDQEEAFAFADKIGVMQNGTLLQWDSPYNLYHCPTDPFVANFIGQGVLVPGQWHNDSTLETELGPVQCQPQGHNHQSVTVLLRPDDILHDPDSGLSGQVVGKVFSGTHTLYTLELASQTQILASFPSHLDFTIGQQVPIRLYLKHPISFPT